jgi:long-chain fatty acid transport protein
MPVALSLEGENKFTVGLVYLDKNTGWQGEIYGYAAVIESQFGADSITDKSSQWTFIPGFFVAKAYDNYAVGFGFYVPYAGGGAEYEHFQGSPYDLSVFAGWGCFTFSAAYKLRPYLAVGAGLSIYGGLLEMESFNPSLFAVTKSDYSGLSGYGGHVGLMYKPTDTIGIGFVARSSIQVNMDGTVEAANVKQDSKVSFTMPSSYTVGLGYQPNKNFTVGLAFWYRLYSDTSEMIFKTAGVESSMKTYFKDSWLVGIGAEYIINNKFTVRGGLKYDQGSTKKEGLNPAFNDIDFLLPSIGIAYNITKSMELNVDWNAAFGVQERYESKNYDKFLSGIYAGIRFK